MVYKVDSEASWKYEYYFCPNKAHRGLPVNVYVFYKHIRHPLEYLRI